MHRASLLGWDSHTLVWVSPNGVLSGVVFLVGLLQSCFSSWWGLAFTGTATGVRTCLPTDVSSPSAGVT